MLIPETLINFAVILGFLGIIATLVLFFIPFQKTIQIVTFLISVSFFSFGLYLLGAINQKKEWEEKVKQLELDLERARSTVNIKTVTKVITRTQKIKERGDEIIRFIDRLPNDSCVVSKPLIAAHNAAAKNESIVEIEETVTTRSHNEATKPILRLAPKK